MSAEATQPGAAPERGSLSARAARWIVLLLAPFVVFHHVSVGGYTFSFGTFAANPGFQAGDSPTVPVLDPGAGSSQDEPWLFLIRKSLLAGELPVVNLWNGLGAPLFESLQPGVAYPLNLALPLLPAHSSWFFDLFAFLHVQLLLCGLYVLLRLYAREPIAFVLALVIGLSGVSYQHLNMVHFRSFVWLPWALAAAVHVARGSTLRRHALLFIGAHACAIAAGALQEAFLGSIVIGATFLAELVYDKDSVAPRRTRLLRMAALTACSTLLASPAVVPYLAARAQGDLFTQATADRSTIPLNGDAIFSVLLPHVHGLYPYLLRIDRSIRWLSNYATIGAFLAILSFLTLALHRAPRRRLFVALALILLALGLKVQHLPWLDFVGSVPFLSEILFTKYHLSLFVLLGVTSAIGLEQLARLDAGRRRRLVIGATAIVAVLLGLIALHVASSASWKGFDSVPESVREEFLRVHSASIAGFLLCALVLAFVQRDASWWLALIVVVQAERVAPRGWLKRNWNYWTPYDAAVLATGTPRERVLTALPSNQNILLGIESVAVFDPVHLKSVHTFYPLAFRLDNAGFIMHPISPPPGLEASELDAARLLGVTRIHGEAFATKEGVTQLSETIYALDGTLPRAYLLRREAFERINRELRTLNARETVEAIRRELESTPPLANLAYGSRSVSFDVTAPFDGVLVVAQAHASAWTLDGVAARPFLSILCAWDVRVDAPRRVEVAYWPRGLRTSLPAAVFGLIGAALVMAFAFGTRRGPGAPQR